METKITKSFTITPQQIKRFKKELELFDKEKLHYCTTFQSMEDPFIWYFLIVGQKNTPYYRGEYIGKIKYPQNYPLSAPNYFMLTPSGRFEIDKSICLTNSGFHASDWTPTWTVVNTLIGFYSIWINDKEGGIAHIHLTKDVCERYAYESCDYNRARYPEIYMSFKRDYLNCEDIPASVAEAKAPEEKAPEEKIVEEKIVEEKIVEEKIVEAKAPEEKIVEEKIVEAKKDLEEEKPLKEKATRAKITREKITREKIIKEKIVNEKIVNEKIFNETEQTEEKLFEEKIKKTRKSKKTI